MTTAAMARSGWSLLPGHRRGTASASAMEEGISHSPELTRMARVVETSRSRGTVVGSVAPRRNAP